jgi:hypothetical protein
MRFEAPSRESILQQLREYNNAATTRQDHIILDEPLSAVWINDGLELEDDQYVSC